MKENTTNDNQSGRHRLDRSVQRRRVLIDGGTVAVADGLAAAGLAATKPTTGKARTKESTGSASTSSAPSASSTTADVWS